MVVEATTAVNQYNTVLATSSPATFLFAASTTSSPPTPTTTSGIELSKPSISAISSKVVTLASRIEHSPSIDLRQVLMTSSIQSLSSISSKVVAPVPRIDLKPSIESSKSIKDFFNQLTSTPLSSTTKQSFNYILQSFVVSAIATSYFLISFLVIFHNIDFPRYNYVYFSNRDATVFASVYKASGLRVAPVFRGFLNSYFIDAAPAWYEDVNDQTSVFYYWTKAVFFLHPYYFGLVVSDIVFAIMIFKPNRTGCASIAFSTFVFFIFTVVSTDWLSKTILSNLEAAKPGAGEDEEEDERFTTILIVASLVYTCFLPTLCSIAAKTSNNLMQRMHGKKIFFSILIYQAVNFIFFRLFHYFILPPYFAETTSLVHKLLLRGFVLTFGLRFMIETSWQLVRYLRAECKVESERLHLFVCVPVIATTTLGRLMQSGATDWQTSVALEVVASCVEIYIAHGLLKGMTPLGGTKFLISKVKMILFKTKAERNSIAREIAIQKAKARQRIKARARVATQGRNVCVGLSLSGDGMHSTKVHPLALGLAITDSVNVDDTTATAKATATDTDTSSSKVAEIDMLRASYCLNTYLFMTISESSLIFFCLILTLATPFNPGSPGSDAIPPTQAITSFVVMCIGEVMLTNSAVAWMSKRPQYDVDLSLAWFTRDKSLFNVYTLILSIMPLTAFNSVFNAMCLTSFDDNEYVFTACPLPPENVSEMSRVGLSWNSSSTTG